MRCFLRLIPVFFAFAACANNAFVWDLEAAKKEISWGARDYILECAQECYLIRTVRNETAYKIPLYTQCGRSARLCFWREEFINIYIPKGKAKKWSYGGFDYRLRDKSLDGDIEYWMIEESRDGEKTKTYFVSPETRDFIMVVHNTEHCLATPWRGKNRSICSVTAHDSYLVFYAGITIEDQMIPYEMKPNSEQ